MAQVPAPRTSDAEHVQAASSSLVMPAVDRGRTAFRATCGFCHGAEANGGATGPSLLSSPLITADSKAMETFLKAGKPAAGMPPFPSLGAAEVADLAAFIRERRAARAPSAAMNPAAIVVGDAATGRAYFNGAGQCANCHSPDGDLRAIGTRYNPMVLQARMINPRLNVQGTTSPALPQVKVITPGGVFEGSLVQLNDFFVALVDTSGVRHTFARDNAEPAVEVTDPTEFHRSMLFRWTDRTMHDLTAYLVTLK